MYPITALLFCCLFILIPSATSSRKQDEENSIFIQQNLNSIPRNLSNQIKNLILSDNSITEIQENDLQNYQKLSNLILNRNAITTSDDLRGIDTAKELRLLDLSENNLLTLNLGIFRSNYKLKVLILDYNYYIQIDKSTPNLPHLQQLSLRKCELVKIPWPDLRGFPNLKLLDLCDNPIANISEEIVQSMPDSMELKINNDLCLVLQNRSDVKTKKINITCCV